MEVHLTPDLQAKVDQRAAQTGRQAAEFIEDAMAGYFAELAHLGATLHNRYDDLKSGRVSPIDGEVAFARLRAKREARRVGRT